MKKNYAQELDECQGMVKHAKLTLENLNLIKVSLENHSDLFHNNNDTAIRIDVATTNIIKAIVCAEREYKERTAQLVELKKNNLP